MSGACTQLYSAHDSPPQTEINIKKVRSSGACHAVPTSQNHNDLEILKKRAELVVHCPTDATTTLTQTWLLFAWCSAVVELRC